jgi:hypothetical protein
MGRIQRQILRLWIALLNQPLQDDEYKSVLISGLAILGMREDGGWLDAEDYTPKYSAVIVGTFDGRPRGVRASTGGDCTIRGAWFESRGSQGESIKPLRMNHGARWQGSQANAVVIRSAAASFTWSVHS